MRATSKLIVGRPVRRGRVPTTFRWSWLATWGVLLFAFAAPALAAPVDVRSDHVAQRAYEQFLKGLLSETPAWHQADDAYISSISTSCPNVLAAINLLPTSSVNVAAVTAFAEEAGADLSVTANLTALPSLAKMTSALSKLRWSRHKTTATINRYLTTAKQFFSLTPSDLCADAGALAASNAATTPPGTLQWLATLGRDIKHYQATLTAFVGILTRYESRGDSQRIHHINHLVDQVGSAGQQLINAEGSKLFTALGLAT